MKQFKKNNNEYIKKIEDRISRSHVYFEHQDIGLLLAELLHDKKHKALYMKLAKKHKGDKLIALAKSILEKKDVRNPAAYFMKVLKNEK